MRDSARYLEAVCPGCSAGSCLTERTRLEGSVCDVSMAHTLFFSYLFFTNSGWYRLRLFEAQDVRVFGVLIIQSHVNPALES